MAVAQPRAKDADLLSACQARRRTNGRNGTVAPHAIDMPCRSDDRKSVEVERPNDHGLVDATLPLLARRVAEELDLVAVWIGRVEAAGDAMVGGALQQAALGEQAVR